jgi:hypothetical protein
MNAALIAQLLVTFGPSALSLVAKLRDLWAKPNLTPAEVDEILALATKSYDDYRNACTCGAN